MPSPAPLSPRAASAWRAGPLAIGSALASLGLPAALAMPLDSGNPELKLKLNWDTTVKLSAATRLHDPSPTLVANPALDDGDRNFSKGLISSRVDVLTEFEAKYQRMGLRLSAAGWYDSVYNRSNDNDSFGALGGPFPTTNHSGPVNEFTADTRDLHGRKAELLDAFVYAGFDVGERRANVRLGRHTVLYGESLFLGANGIAAAQAPIDVVKALSVPSTQFKELMRPVPQVSDTLQLTDAVSLGAYYQFRWEPNRIPGVGSYFSFSDNAGAGAERLVPPALANVPKGADQEPDNAGQWGLQMRWRAGESDFGLYAVRFHAKDFEQYLYLQPTGAPPPAPPVAPGGYQLVFAQGITALGASVSRSFGDLNVAAELSVRQHMPFQSSVVVPPGQAPDNDANPAYAVGRSGHAQVSVLWQVPRTPLFGEATLAAEVAVNHRTFQQFYADRDFVSLTARTTF